MTKKASSLVLWFPYRFLKGSGECRSITNLDPRGQSRLLTGAYVASSQTLQLQDWRLYQVYRPCKLADLSLLAQVRATILDSPFWHRETCQAPSRPNLPYPSSMIQRRLCEPQLHHRKVLRGQNICEHASAQSIWLLSTQWLIFQIRPTNRDSGLLGGIVYIPVTSRGGFRRVFPRYF